mgnify:CR=1 FL=1
MIEIKTDVEAQKRELSKPGAEPMVKGISLAFAMDQLLDITDQLSGITSAFLKSQMEFNAIAGTHIHVSPFFRTTIHAVGRITDHNQFRQ